VFDIDISASDGDTTEVTFWNGSGEVAFFLNITGYTKKGSGTAGKIKFYAEIADSMWLLRQVTDATTAAGYTVADGYKTGAVVMYGGVGGSIIVASKVYCDRLYVCYDDDADSLGHITLDVCVRRD